MYIYTHIYIHTHIHTYTHIYSVILDIPGLLVLRPTVDTKIDGRSSSPVALHIHGSTSLSHVVHI